MTYTAYITKITNVRPFPDPKTNRVLLGQCFGNQVVVGLDTKENDLGLYLPVDGKLSLAFLTANNLMGTKDPVTGVRTGGYFDEKGKVRAQKFRGEKSDGYFCSLNALKYTGIDITLLSEGMALNKINEIPFCEKYITEKTYAARDPKPREKTKFPLFHEHLDTAQLAYNIDSLVTGNVLIITEKVHGTSQRTAHTVKITQPAKWGQIINGLLKREFIKPTTSYEYVCGTRRVVIKDFERHDGYYKESEGFRQVAHDKFLGKLHKGEAVYYEVVGYSGPDSTIMPSADNTKIGDKEFTKTYGKKTTYHYGCQPGECKTIVYRMTMTNEDGVEMDYSWNTVKRRCNEMAIQHAPQIGTVMYMGDKNDFLAYCTSEATGASMLTPAHIREGVVVRVDGSDWDAYKHKSFNFKVLEGIVKDTGIADMEESQEST